MRISNFILLFTLVTFNSFGQANFSKEEVLSDLKTLRESLEDAHYNVYAYTTKEEFDRVYQKAKESVTQDSLSLLEATGVFQQLITAVKNGHTEIPFPGQSYGVYAYAGGTVFPLEVAFEDGKSLIRKNWSGNEKIRIDDELISINGVSMKDLVERFSPHISAERPYFKLTKMELYSLPRLYWQLFGQEDSFEVEIRSNGEVNTYQLQAINLIEDFEMKRTEVINASLSLKFFDQVAYLNTGSFSWDEEAYQRYIDSAFTVINERKTENLIIDLRNNGGGDNSFSDFLISYIADQPFQWNSSFTLKTSKFLKEHVRQNYDTTAAFWKSVLTHQDGEVYEYEFEDYQPQPEEKRFKGKVYVLVNRQSHSQSTVAASQFQDYGLATIVGEETGDYPSLYASVFRYNLPNTQVSVQVSKGYIVRVNGSKKEEGVIPDIFIKDHLLDENDEVLEGILEQLTTNR